MRRKVETDFPPAIQPEQLTHLFAFMRQNNTIEPDCGLRRIGDA